MSMEYSKEHSYIDKIPEWDMDSARDVQLLRFLEGLNRAEWRDLFRDLATKPSDVSPHLSLRMGEDVISYLASYLEQLGLPIKQNASRALDGLVVECLANSANQDLNITIKTYFFLAKILEEGIRPNILQAVINNRNFSQEVRQDAAAVLANLREPLPHDYWLNLDFEENPFLAPAAIAAVGESNPHLAFDVLSQLNLVEEQRPEEVEELIPDLKYPIRAVLKSLRFHLNNKELLFWVREAVDKLSPRIKQLISNSHPYTELFSSYISEEGKSGSLVLLPARQPWQDLVNKAISTGELLYYYTGYQRGNVFNRDQVIDEENIEREFLSAIRDEIKEYAKKPDIQISLARAKIFSLNKLVKDLIEGKILMPEVGYGTRARGEKAFLIRVGQIEKLAALVPYHLQDKFRVSLEIQFSQVDNNNVQQTLPTLDRVIGFCIREELQWVNQPNSAVADISDDLVEKYMQKLGTTNLPLFVPGGVEDPDLIRAMLTPKGKRSKPRYIGLLDYLTAVGIKKADRGKKIDLYEVNYNVPLPVGYFTPKGDPDFLKHIWKALHKILFSEQQGAWDPRFNRLMNKSEVSLDLRPTIQVYNPESSTWEEASEQITRITDAA